MRVCENGAQQVYFIRALEKLKTDHPGIYSLLSIPELRTNNYTRKNKLGLADNVNWLLKGDIHFILSHVHQGMIIPTHYDWTANIIENEG